MCGISGIIDFNKSTSNKLDYIELMNNSLEHRGPDDSGMWENENQTLAFGHRRLSILDLSQAGHQPMHDSKNVLIFNGEIFNFKELNQKYLKDEHFSSNSDSETILKLYAKLGIEMLDKLNGMFAFALWDNEKEQILLARDLSGKKPLYFTQKGNYFSLASEIKALFSLPWVDKKLDDAACYDFLTYNAVHTPTTMFEGIEKFKAGHFMLINKSGVQSYKAFRELKQQQIDFSDEKELEDLIFQKLDSSVEKRMLADVPVGLFLSGGVDSSAILALMSKHTAQQISSFTIGFENQETYTETQFAEVLAKKYNTNHFVKTVSKNDLLEFIPKIVDIYDEPQADTTAIPIYFISKLAHENDVKVILNGDGADELFAGYTAYLNYFKAYNKFKTLQNAPLFVRKLVKEGVHRFKANSSLDEIAERLVLNQELFWPGASGFKESQKRNFLSKDFLNTVSEATSYTYVENLKKDYLRFSGGEFDFLNWMCFAGYKQAVMERFLFRSDRLGMANSIEARSPFLEADFIEFALSIPSKYKIKNGVPKYILKKALERELSPEILYRKKMGFCLPLKEWAGETIVQDLKKDVSLFCKETGIFKYEEIKQQISAFENGKSDGINRLWTIYFFMNWYKKWF